MTESLRGFLLAAELQILWPLGIRKSVQIFFLLLLRKHLSKVIGAGKLKQPVLEAE